MIKKKKVLPRTQNVANLSCQGTWAAPEFWRRLRLFLLWLTDMSAAEQPSTAAEKKKKKETRSLSCGVLACLFYGLIFVGHDAEGTLQRGEFLTICQGRLSGDACYWNRDIFICFKDSSGHLLCHWKWSLALQFELTVCLIQIWQPVVWLAKRAFNVITGTAKTYTL